MVLGHAHERFHIHAAGPDRVRVPGRVHIDGHVRNVLQRPDGGVELAHDDASRWCSKRVSGAVLAFESASGSRSMIMGWFSRVIANVIKDEILYATKQGPIGTRARATWSSPRPAGSLGIASTIPHHGDIIPTNDRVKNLLSFRSPYSRIVARQVPGSMPRSMRSMGVRLRDWRR